jgi:hypothetical protein
MVLFGDDRIEPSQDRQCTVGGVRHRAGSDRYPFGRSGPEPGQDHMELFPALCAAAEMTDLQQRLDRLDENLIVAIGRIIERIDRLHQYLVSGINIAVRVEQVIGACHGAGQPAAMLWVRVPCLVEKTTDVAHVPGDGLAEIGRLG